ncbi:expansin EXLX1 family cellulose-binding protein [Nocardia sp. alder85J]|uniref:expansin EXLX1 family cellulose-binding protein n=1 Tax=Nocardia sp. alder85J TaxID=2862949 RepID=UPI001CD33BB0|nr:expansin EXLX1 family cellulose-binding protein [Nocardia sp. alder85J]MCX4092630.1 expansin EXLX1 family cellulose-binding protein [Nocardia sp. alder85J]
MHRVTGNEHVRAVRPWLWTALVLAAAVAAVWVLWPEPTACHTASGPPPASVVGAVRTPVAAAIADEEHVDAPIPRQARYFALGGSEVACSYPDLPADGFYVGVPSEEFDGGALCGASVELDGPLGSVRALVVDRCPGCLPNQYDVSTAAFARIANRATGIADIRVARVHNPTPAPDLMYRIQNGSSGDWLGLLFAETGNPVSRVEIRATAGGTGYLLSHGSDNYWTISGAGPGPFIALVTDTDGHRVRVPGVAVSPGRVQHTGIQLYDPPPEPAAPDPAPKPAATTAAAPTCS